MKIRLKMKYLSMLDRLNLSRIRPVGYAQHIEEAIKWLCRAQDATPDDGFSRSYSVISEWDHSYPETTGYIIPTLWDHWSITKEEDIKQRAIRASDWLIEQQFPKGGIPAGTTATTPRVPTIFNTGQVIFGWIETYNYTKDDRYLNALSQACQWLTDVQEENGTWAKYSSVVATYNLNTYNARTAWALLKGGELTGNKAFKNAAIKNIEWTLTQANENGWFENNCLTDNAQPFTHTIAYTIRGILESGLILNNQKFIDAATHSASEVLKKLYSNGYLAGRFDKDWNATTNYSCLTGDCQMAIIWYKLYKAGKGEHFLDGAHRIIDYVCSTQDLNSINPGIRGGIKGSYPIDGEYGRYEYPNWAAKFFVDALILYGGIIEGGKNSIE